MRGSESGNLFRLANWAVNCVIKTNPGLHFSVMTVISTMILTRRIREALPFGAGTSHRGRLALRGTIGKEIDHGS